MDWFIVFSALSLAAMYGLLGIGISLTWASVGMLNLAHGFTFACAGYGAYLASKHLVDTPTSGTRRAHRRRRRHPHGRRWRGSSSAASRSCRCTTGPTSRSAA